MIDKKKVMKQTEEAAQRSGRFRYLKKNATTNLRVLEYKDKDGDLVFAQLQTEHRREGQSGKGLGVCRQEVFDQPCAMCKVNQIAGESGKDRPFVSRSRYVINAIDVNDSSPQVRLWIVPTTVFDQIAELALSDEWADIFEPKTGTIVGVKREGEGLDTNYKIIPGRRAYPVGKPLLDQVIDPLDEIRDFGLENQCATIGVAVEDIFEANELKAIGEQPEKAGKAPKKSLEKSPERAPKKALKKASALKSPLFDIGQSVRYDDDEDVYEVTKVDGDEYTIKDKKGDEFLADADHLTAVEEEEGEAFATGDSVLYANEKKPYTIISIDSDTQVTIRDSKGNDWEVDIGDLEKEDDGIPFEDKGRGGSKKSNKSKGDAPKCFGDPNLYDGADQECITCGHYYECTASVNLNKPDTGDHHKPAKKAGNADVDDIVSGIVGSRKKK